MKRPRAGAPDSQISTSRDYERKRTAVLVVHGMGSQRALETVRGVVEAAWLQDRDDPASAQPPRQVWTHPEYSAVDIDLSVITTSRIAVATPGGSEQRSIDFHELYWAHLMSETRAVAVLLWLFELVRKGPQLRKGLNPLWWAASIFLSVVLLSLMLLASRLVQLLTGVACTSYGPSCQLHLFLDAPIFALFSVGLCSLLVAWRWKATRWIKVLAAIVIISLGLIGIAANFPVTLSVGADLLLPIAAALLVAYFTMARQGVMVMLVTYLASSLLFVVYIALSRWLDIGLGAGVSHAVARYWVLWSLSENTSLLIAFIFILLYLALNALFLQPYLGDAARYFRNSPANVAVRRDIRGQAVDTLDALHTSGRYDRIVVVAHSLGTVVAYDMLRAYFSRICNNLPSPAALGPAVQEIDSLIVDGNDPEPIKAQKRIFLRSKAREVIRSIAGFKMPESLDPAVAPPTKWLVTDFVTLGSALTHAHYLMCTNIAAPTLQDDFERRVDEREFPTCPPARNGSDGLLLFTNTNTGMQEFHNGAVFGLTRWSNLYFPIDQILWGDTIGGPLAQLFGSHIRDIPVSTSKPPEAAFFTHTSYWNIAWPLKRKAPQILALQAAINLEDADV